MSPATGNAAPGRPLGKKAQPSQPKPDPALAEIERAMVRIRRRQSRRVLGTMALAALPEQVDLNQIAVVDAVDEGGPQSDGDVTVGMVADRLGVDPSRASRLVTATINSGFVRRVTSQQDGRRICLELTERGRQVIDEARRSRQALYQRLLKSWEPQERADFARLLTKFVDAMDSAARP